MLDDVIDSVQCKMTSSTEWFPMWNDATRIVLLDLKPALSTLHDIIYFNTSNICVCFYKSRRTVLRKLETHKYFILHCTINIRVQSEEFYIYMLPVHVLNSYLTTVQNELNPFHRCINLSLCYNVGSNTSMINCSRVISWTKKRCFREILFCDKNHQRSCISICYSL